MSDKKSSSKTKKRHWAMLVYPESAPSDWRDLLRETGLPCAISPLHDKDVNEKGEAKKPHWHVIVSWSGPTTLNVAKALVERLNGPEPKGLENVKGHYRYFTHLDNPEKYQYDEKDIRTINGFNIADFVELTKSEVNIIKKNLQQLIRDESFVEYADFMDYLLDGDMGNEYDVAANNTYFFDKYIASRRNKGIQAKKATGEPIKVVRVDSETGEVLDEVRG